MSSKINILSSTAAMHMAAGAIAFIAMAATVATVRAETTTPNFRTSVEKSIDHTMRLSPDQGNTRKGVATLAVVIDGQGAVQSASIVKSSGYNDYDREALRTANHTKYPATGKTRTMAMVLGFNQKVDAAASRDGKHQVLAWQANQRISLASK